MTNKHTLFSTILFVSSLKTHMCVYQTKDDLQNFTDWNPLLDCPKQIM